MKKIYTFFLLFYSFLTFSQSDAKYYSHQELLKFPVKAAYYLDKKDEYSLSKFLSNEMGMRLDNENSAYNISIFTQTLDGSYDYDKTVTFYSILVDKRSSHPVIHSWYLKNGKNVVVDKSFFDYLEAHPRAIRIDKGFALLIGGESMKNLDSQKVIIGIIPEFLSNYLKYQVFFLKNDNSMSLNEILKAINF
jgi:hypothetical protein